MCKVGKDMSHCVQDVYSVLGCVVRPGWGGGGGLKVEGNVKDIRLETTRLKKLGGIESGGGFLSSFYVVGGLRYGNSNIIDFLFGV